MGPYQRTPKQVAKAISCFGVRSVGPVGDFLDTSKKKTPRMATFLLRVSTVTLEARRRTREDSKKREHQKAT